MTTMLAYQHGNCRVKRTYGNNEVVLVWRGLSFSYLLLESMYSYSLEVSQRLFSVGKIAEKAVCRSVFYIALYFECRINKKALLQTVLLAILPTRLQCWVTMLASVCKANVCT